MNEKSPFPASFQKPCRSKWKHLVGFSEKTPISLEKYQQG